MWLLRIFFNIIVGLLVGIFDVGIISALPFPFFMFPLIPIFLALTIIWRVRPTTFWYLVLAVAVGDLYRASGFGVGLLALAVTTIVALQLSEGLVTHRSVVGCSVVGALVGALWALCTTLFSRVFDFYTLGIIILVQSVVTASVVSGAYLLLPLWWKARSPVIIRTRTL